MNKKKKAFERLHSITDTEDRVLYSSSEMAARCGVSRKTWWKWVNDGIAPAPVLVGNVHKWLASDIERWKKDLRKEYVDRKFRQWNGD